MAPLEYDRPGRWGPTTATIDWCEANYEVSVYIAEFWNTISNFFMVVPPLIGTVFAIKDKFENRFVWCHLALVLVGIGSTCFHGTLLYEMQLLDELPMLLGAAFMVYSLFLLPQADVLVKNLLAMLVELLDELPMVWGSALLVYSLIEVNGAPKSHNRRLQTLLTLYCVFVTVVYLTIKNPIFHEAAYGALVLGMVFTSIRVVRNFDHSFVLFMIGLVAYAVGFIIWNMDQVFCPKLRVLRSQVSPSLRPVLQGHAWWHVLAGVGTYLGLLFNMHARQLYLKKIPRVEMVLGVWPYVRCDPSA